MRALRASSGAERPVRRSSADDGSRYSFASQPRQGTRRSPDLGIALPYRLIVRPYGYLSSLVYFLLCVLRLHPSLRKRRAYENLNSGHRPTPSPLQAIPHSPSCTTCRLPTRRLLQRPRERGPEPDVSCAENVSGNRQGPFLAIARLLADCPRLHPPLPPTLLTLSQARRDAMRNRISSPTAPSLADGASRVARSACGRSRPPPFVLSLSTVPSSERAC